MSFLYPNIRSKPETILLIDGAGILISYLIHHTIGLYKLIVHSDPAPIFLAIQYQ